MSKCVRAARLFGWKGQGVTLTGVPWSLVGEEKKKKETRKKTKGEEKKRKGQQRGGEKKKKKKRGRTKKTGQRTNRQNKQAGGRHARGDGETSPGGQPRRTRTRLTALTRGCAWTNFATPQAQAPGRSLWPGSTPDLADGLARGLPRSTETEGEI